MLLQNITISWERKNEDLIFPRFFSQNNLKIAHYRPLSLRLHKVLALESKKGRKGEGSEAN